MRQVTKYRSVITFCLFALLAAQTDFQVIEILAEPLRSLDENRGRNLPSYIPIFECNECIPANPNTTPGRIGAVFSNLSVPKLEALRQSANSCLEAVGRQGFSESDILKTPACFRPLPDNDKTLLDEVVSEIALNMVSVVTNGGHCTGYILPNGEILTAKHCLIKKTFGRGECNATMAAGEISSDLVSALKVERVDPADKIQLSGVVSTKSGISNDWVKLGNSVNSNEATPGEGIVSNGNNRNVEPGTRLLIPCLMVREGWYRVYYDPLKTCMALGDVYEGRGFKYLCSTDRGCSGAPVFALQLDDQDRPVNARLVGVHVGPLKSDPANSNNYDHLCGQTLPDETRINIAVKPPL